ncbi:M1 family peptidase [Vreelandella andesensis]|uniref:M1 family peptidase n=1 Tax=Vreelandella andesensis TaxID=447567 RepID=A0A433KRH4_9GAMM|nr:M1 family aminopeptidase [Halomonas andesensis]RUR32181.1 M1 family peptidase [Halomonas andesensis]
MFQCRGYRSPLLWLSSLSTLLWLLMAGFAWGESSKAPAERTLFIQFDPATRSLQGELRQPLLTKSRFRLLEGLALTTALRGDEELTVIQESDGYWQLPQATSKADSTTPITLRWEGMLPATQPGSRHQIAIEGSLLPTRAGWYPDLSDTAMPLVLTVSVPDGQLTVATGSLVEEQRTRDNHYVARFYHPNTRDVDIATGPWQLRKREVGGVTLRTLFPETLNAAFGETYLQHAAEQLTLFQARLGPLPYKSFSIAATPAPVGLAFPGFTLLGERVIPLPFIPSTSLPHELMHAWWGAGVNIDYPSGNWAEALTTYLADYALAEQRGEAETVRRRWLADLAALPNSQEVALAAFRGAPDSAGRLIGYQHGAMLFHMLRQRIGDEAFDRGLRHLANEWMHRTADWQALIDAFSMASGESQQAFFTAWLTRPGRPTLHIESVQTETHDDGYRISGTLVQSGQHAPWPMEIPLVVSTEEGSVYVRQPMHDTHQPFELHLAARPRSLEIDPGADLLRHPGPTPAILRQLMLDPTTQVLALNDTLYPLARQVLGRDAESLASPIQLQREEQPPLLVIGTTEELNEWHRRNALPAPPQPMASAGEARFWMAPGTRIGLLSGNDVAAITQLAASLRHHGQQSYVIQRQAVQGQNVDTSQAGRWPADASPLTMSFTATDFR